ncbi:MAG: hypothetical protein JW881_01590 [Spirochaetales bacterium]|nr:hypothetical protein [Spirochaetales bacterium]
MTYFPTKEHKDSADAVLSFFKRFDFISSVLLTCSCARGKSVPASCVDIGVLLKPDVYRRHKDELERQWNEFNTNNPVIMKMLVHGRFAHMDVDIITGDYDDKNYCHHWMSGPDSFELDIGNNIRYSLALHSNDDYYETLRRTWLPYYPEHLRTERLEMVLAYCRNNIEHIEPYVKRGLYFQAFDRFYNALREFLQALFIHERTYPICYEKWIKEQLVEILNLPGLYERIVSLFEITRFQSDKMTDNGNVLYHLIDEYILSK